MLENFWKSAFSEKMHLCVSKKDDPMSCGSREIKCC